jgi:hypothetical protein
MKRTLITIALAALAAIGLSACQTNPAKPAAEQPVAVAPAPTKTLVEMQYELDKAAMELENLRTMALIKFGAESGSDFAKGIVAGMINGGGGSQAAPAAQRPAFVQIAQQQQQHAAEVDLRRAELAERNSLWNRGLQVTDRVLGFKMFSKGLDQERYRIDASNGQQRYLFDTLRGTQQDGYGFSNGAYSQGSTATLNGVAAGRQPAATSTEITTTAE